jgi:hypothetical protein
VFCVLEYFIHSRTTYSSLVLIFRVLGMEIQLKQSHYTPHAWGERRYSSYLTSALNEGEWSVSRPGRALASGKGTPVPIVPEAEWAIELVWIQRLEEKSFRFCRRGSNLNRRVV